MKKKYALLVTILFLCLMDLSVYAEDEISPPTVSAQAAVMIEAGTGRILFAENENEQLSMASTTKIMTALLTVECNDLDTYFEVDVNAIKAEGTSMGLLEGDQVSLRTLAYGMLLQSGNDAANAAAVKISGSVSEFANLMNERAQALELYNTHFVTPSGLDDEEHYSTALDMAKLAVAALKNPVFSEICKQSSAKVKYGNPPYDRTLTNHNRLVRESDEVIGIKTGFTKKSGRCLVSAIERDGIRLIVVTLNAPDDWDDHRTLYEYGYATLETVEIDNTGLEETIPVVGVTAKTVTAVEATPARMCIEEDQLAALERRVIKERFVYGPVEAGITVGRVEYLLDGNIVGSTTLVTAQTIEQQTDEKGSSVWDRIKQFFTNIF